MKNRTREIRTSGSVRDEDGQPPHLVGHRRQFLHLAAGAAALSAVSRTSRAQAYPSRPITMIVPFAPGGLTDVIGRILAEGMRTSLGQPVIIENVGGATGSIGTGQVARAALDGYTLVIGCSMAQESPWRFPQWMSSETEVGMFKSKAPALDLDHTVSESLPLLFDR